MNNNYKKAKIWFIFQTYIATLVLNVTYGQEQAQYFQLWLREGCPGLPDGRVTGNAKIFIPHQSPLTASFKANGLWTMNLCNSTSCNRRVEGGNGSRCVPMIVADGYNNLDLEMHGNADQNEGWLYLFPEANLQGTPKIVTEAEVFTMTVRSYFFTGDHPWQYVPAPITCLCPTSTVINNGYGFTYDMSTNFQMTSVANRCDAGCQ